MFDELGAANISHKDRCHEWLINLLHEIDGMLALRSNHDAIRMHQVCNRTAFAQKFRIADNIEVGAVAVISFYRFSHFFSPFHWLCAPVVNHSIILTYRSDLPRDFLE